MYVMMDTFIDLFEIVYNIPVFFYSDFKQYVITNKRNAGCSHFLGHSVDTIVNISDNFSYFFCEHIVFFVIFADSFLPAAAVTLIVAFHSFMSLHVIALIILSWRRLTETVEYLSIVCCCHHDS